MSPILSRTGGGGGFSFGFGRRASSPIYAITPSTTSVNEGSSVTFNVSTINVQSGTTLYWTVNSVSGTVNASDFNEGVSGSFVIAANAGSVVLNVSNDATTEGSESFQLQVRTGSTAGPIVATSSTVTIGDTLSATGGTVSTPGNGYKYHTFTSPGSFVVSSVGPGTVELLVVAGGGGGGYYQSGGGGAGGLAYNPAFLISATTYPITVGGGGASSSNGNPSSSLGITAVGGGRGGARSPSNVQAGPGGSGGGAGSQHPGPSADAGSGTQPSQPQPSGTLNYGNPGGGNSFPAGGGGGGAGAAGGNAGPSTLSGKGGDGIQYPQFTGPLIGVPSLAPLSGYFAGGGSGAGEYITDQGVQPGGAGGGGGASAGNPAVTNSGGGGSGARSPGSPTAGGNGGSGIVVIRYLT